MTPDERAARIHYHEYSGEGIREHAERIVALEELVRDLYCLCYPQSFDWEVTSQTYDKYSPCELCEKAHGGKSPCASTSKDLEEECCRPFQAVVIADRIRELGVVE